MSKAQKSSYPISVFVSSTYKDLAKYRTEVEKQLISLEQAVKGMEYFGSSSSTPLEVCKKKLQECQLMILLLGVSYGSIEKNTGKSYTELEYDYAEKLNIPILVYVADLSSSNIEIALNAVDYDNKDKLDMFIERVKNNHLLSYFTSVDDLGKRIAHDVPAELEKLSFIQSIPEKNQSLKENVSEEELKEGAIKFEKFWLRPQRLAGETVPVRLRINKKFSGWKVKDELIRAIGQSVGDSITTEVTVQLGNRLIDDDGDTDLFADGDAADWLLDQIINAGVVEGSVIDCYVRFIYCRAPVGANNKMINKVCLSLIKGIKYVEIDNNYLLSVNREIGDTGDLTNLISLLKSSQLPL